MKLPKGKSAVAAREAKRRLFFENKLTEAQKAEKVAVEADTSNKRTAYLAFERLNWPLNGLNDLFQRLIM